MTSKQHKFERLQLSGLNFDIPDSMLPPDQYSAGNNVEAFDIGMRSIRGHIEAYPSPIFPPEHLAFNKNAGAFNWIYAGGSGIGATDGVNHFDITPVVPPTSIYPNVNWTDANLNGIITLNNGVDPEPWYWDNEPANPMQPLPNWPANAIAQSMRAYNYYLIAMNVQGISGSFDNFLMWSDAAEPGNIPDSWNPLPENSAGFNTLSDTIGSIVDGIQFRDSFLLMKEHSTYLMDFVGGNFVFAFRKVFTTSGILTANCAAEYLGNVAILSDGDFIMTDGQQADSLIDKRMRGWLFNNIDTDNYRNAFVVSYHQENQIWCCFPQNGSVECTAALVWDASDNKFSIRDLVPPTPHIARGQVGTVTGVLNWDDDPEVWDNDVTTWDKSAFNPTEDALLQADLNLKTYAINEGVDWNGTPIIGRLERAGLDFGNPHRVKLVKGFIPRIIGTEGTRVKIRVGASKNDGNIVEWSDEYLFTIGSPQIVSVFVTGRFIAFSVESDVVSAPPWTMLGAEFMFDWEGLY
jgi:hypothetical protein